MRGGNQAIHFAASNGNLSILNLLTKEFEGNINDITSNGLTVAHCGAQDEKGN